jgi:hypothetical protein
LLDLEKSLKSKNLSYRWFYDMYPLHGLYANKSSVHRHNLSHLIYRRKIGFLKTFQLSKPIICQEF